MQSRGIIKSMSKNIVSGKYEVTVALAECNIDSIQKLQDTDIDIEFKVHREHRSLDANKCLWFCLGKIAEALNCDKWEVYLRMLKRYGKYTYIVVKESAVEAMKAQWRESEVIGDIDINGQTGVQMLCYFGSSTYDTKEMSVLINGVVSEMEEMNLETPTPEHIRKMIEQWKA